MAKKIVYTKQLADAVAKDAKGTILGKFHIVSSQTGKWAVVYHGTVRPLRSFITQKAAISFAKNYAVAKSIGQLVIHGEDGSITHRVSI